MNLTLISKTVCLSVCMTLLLFFVVTPVFTADERGAGTPNGCDPGSGLSFGSALDCVGDVGTVGYGETSGANLQQIIGTIIRGALTLVGAIFLVMMVYGGYNWMIDRGDSERVKVAKDTITRAIIGMVIVMGAYAITSFVTGRLAQAPSTTAPGSGADDATGDIG